MLDGQSLFQQELLHASLNDQTSASNCRLNATLTGCKLEVQIAHLQVPTAVLAWTSVEDPSLGGGHGVDTGWGFLSYPDGVREI